MNYNSRETLNSSLTSLRNTILSDDNWEKRDQQIRKEKEEKRKERFNLLIPPRFRGIGDLTHPKLKESTCSIIWGGFGTGKTWECYSLCKELYLSRVINSFRVATEVELLNDLKSGFYNGQFECKLRDYQQTDLLVVDEVGKANDSNFNKVQLFEILNSRYNWMKRTVLICNAEKKEELFDIMPTALLDRFRETVIHMCGKSRRYTA